MPLPGWIEIAIILIIVLLLFGPGRIGKLAGEFGKGIHNFRKGLDGKEEMVKMEKKQ